MYLLDTDHMSLMDRGGTDGARIRERLRALPPDDVATTIITFEEQMRGWLARIAQAATSERQVAAYRELKRHLQNYCAIAVVEYDENAAAEFGRLRQARLRMGTMDLKIAAVALANNATLLSRNLTDFARVPGLHVEDWTR